MPFRRNRLDAAWDSCREADCEERRIRAEIDIGIRRFWGKNNVRPYLGGGVSFVDGEIEIGNVSFDDSATGTWFDAGVRFALGNHFSLGIGLRVSRADIDLGGESFEAGGEHLSLSAGWGW